MGKALYSCERSDGSGHSRAGAWENGSAPNGAPDPKIAGYSGDVCSHCGWFQMEINGSCLRRLGESTGWGQLGGPALSSPGWQHRFVCCETIQTRGQRRFLAWTSNEILTEGTKGQIFEFRPNPKPAALELCINKDGSTVFRRGIESTTQRGVVLDHRTEQKSLAHWGKKNLSGFGYTEDRRSVEAELCCPST